MTATETDRFVLDNLGLACHIADRLRRLPCVRLLGTDEARSVAFVALVIAARGYDPARGAFSAYASVVIKRHVVAAAMRFAAKTVAQLPTDVDGDDVEPPAPAEPDHIEFAEALEALAGLPDAERQAVERTVLHGETIADAAERLGVPGRTLADRRRRGLQRLRGALA